ncbi:MAG: class D sortase [Candidatus Solibacter usitatus]|nr:class D sortase [Candidatus Solibacter usitatus]
MRLLIANDSLRTALRWTQRVLFACAVSLLGYCGFVLLDAWVFQLRASHELERLRGDERTARSGAARTGSAASPETPAAIGPDGLIGRIEIERIGLSAVVFEGTGKSTLRHAVGHIPSTTLPGQPGNAGLTGHRDTFFRPLRNVVQNDVITVTTLRGECRYRVVSTRVVAPTEVSVLYPTGGEILTLVTCHPFYFVGAAPNRFIVRAERIAATAAAP